MTKNLRTTTLIAQNLRNQAEKSYKLQNSMAKNAYNRTKKSLSKNDTQRKENRAEKEYSPRKDCKSENGKLNLYALIEGKLSKAEEDLIISTLCTLIGELFASKDFMQEKMQHNKEFLTKFSLKLIKGLKKTKSLAKVSFEDKKDRELYLILCNGEVNKKRAPISLLSYVTVQEVPDNSFVVFPCMSEPLLKAFFGEKTAEKILSQETELYYEGRATARLSEKELNALLSNTVFDTHKKLLCHKRLKFKNIQTYTPNAKGSLIITGPPAAQER